MHRLLGLLRSGEPAQAEGIAQIPDTTYVPPQGLADIDHLTERLRHAGLGITVVRHGEPKGIPDDVSLIVYRIVQESLTNVLKHAGLGPARPGRRRRGRRDLRSGRAAGA